MLKVAEAIQKIYPDIQGGFVYWETKQDLTNWENSIDGLIWKNTEYEKPTWDQIEAQFLIINLDSAKAERVATRLTYLKETDWQASAFVKYARRIDDGVASKCQLAINQIDAINACITYEEVEQYPIKF